MDLYLPVNADPDAKSLASIHQALLNYPHSSLPTIINFFSYDQHIINLLNHTDSPNFYASPIVAKICLLLKHRSITISPILSTHHYPIFSSAHSLATKIDISHWKCNPSYIQNILSSLHLPTSTIDVFASFLNKQFPCYISLFHDLNNISTNFFHTRLNWQKEIIWENPPYEQNIIHLTIKKIIMNKITGFLLIPYNPLTASWQLASNHCHIHIYFPKHSSLLQLPILILKALVFLALPSLFSCFTPLLLHTFLNNLNSITELHLSTPLSPFINSHRYVLTILLVNLPPPIHLPLIHLPSPPFVNAKILTQNIFTTPLLQTLVLLSENAKTIPHSNTHTYHPKRPSIYPKRKSINLPHPLSPTLKTKVNHIPSTIHSLDYIYPSIALNSTRNFHNFYIKPLESVDTMSPPFAWPSSTISQLSTYL